MSLEKAKFKAACEKDLFIFAKHCLGYPDLEWSTHGPICEALESETKRKLIVVPRGCLKSTLCSVAYPIWLLIKDPNLRIIIESSLYKNATKFLREIKQQMTQNEDLIELWGEWETKTNWREDEITIKQRKKVVKESSIVVASCETERTGMHADVIIADDLNGPSNSLTDDGRNKVIDHYRLYTSILEPGGTIVVVGTRYHQVDLIGTILHQELGVNADGSDIRFYGQASTLQSKDLL